MKDTLSRRGRNAGISSSAHHRNQGYPSLPNQDFYIGRCRRACRAVRRRISNGDVCLGNRSEEHTSELQSRLHLVCRLLLEKKKMSTLAQSSHPIVYMQYSLGPRSGPQRRTSRESRCATAPDVEESAWRTSHTMRRDRWTW